MAVLFSTNYEHSFKANVLSSTNEKRYFSCAVMVSGNLVTLFSEIESKVFISPGGGVEMGDNCEH